jgi:hypothetical protein
MEDGDVIEVYQEQVGGDDSRQWLSPYLSL